MSNLTCNNNDIVGSFICKFSEGICIIFIMVRWVIYTKIRGLLYIFLIMAEVGNLDTYLGGYFSLFS